MTCSYASAAFLVEGPTASSPHAESLFSAVQQLHDSSLAPKHARWWLYLVTSSTRSLVMLEVDAGGARLAVVFARCFHIGSIAERRLVGRKDTWWVDSIGSLLDLWRCCSSESRRQLLQVGSWIRRDFGSHKGRGRQGVNSRDRVGQSSCNHMTHSSVLGKDRAESKSTSFETSRIGVSVACQYL